MNDLAHDLTNARPVDLARERVEKFIEEANAWIEKVPEIRDEETAARAQTYIEQIDKEIGTKGKLTLAEKAQIDPLRAEINNGKLLYGPLRLLLETCKAALVPKRLAYLARQQAALDAEKKRQQEQASRLAREAFEAAAAAHPNAPVEKRVRAQELVKQAEAAAALAAEPPQRAQVRGLYGGRAASIHKLWRAEILDQLQLYLYYKDSADVLGVLQRLANAEAPAAHREGREIPGCKLTDREIAA